MVEAAREPMLAVTEKGVRKITVCGPTQLLKTELINNIVHFFAIEDPCPIVVMQPDEKLKDTWVLDRLDPMIRDTPALQRVVVDDTHDRKGIIGGHITPVFAGSAADVASRPCRVVVMDEMDKYKTSGSEGDPEKLLEQRLDTFWNSLSVGVCSPTLEGSSKIWARFLDSDQRYLHGTCPYCEEYEKLVWEQVRFVPGDASTAYYECSHCETAWTEFDRRKAIGKGKIKYIATKPFNGHAGFHCNAIATPWQPLTKLVQKYIDAGKDPEKQKVFTNTSLALTWKAQVEVPDDERLYERRESYPIGIVPDRDIKFLSMGVDIQGDRIECQVVGWRRDKQSYSIDYQVFPGFTHTQEPWSKLTDMIKNKTYELEGSSRELPISFVLIDSSFMSSTVQEYVLDFSPNRVRIVRGSDSLMNFYKMGSDITSNFDGSKNKFAHKIWLGGVSYLKTDLYTKLKLPTEDPLAPGQHPPGFCHFPEYDRDFFKGICGESLVLKKGKYVWERHFRKNEPLDTWIYARIAAAMFGLDRFKDAEWDALEGIIEVSKEPQPLPPQRHSSGRVPTNGLWRNPNLRRPR